MSISAARLESNFFVSGGLSHTNTRGWKRSLSLCAALVIVAPLSGRSIMLNLITITNNLRRQASLVVGTHSCNVPIIVPLASCRPLSCNQGSKKKADRSRLK